MRCKNYLFASFALLASLTVLTGSNCVSFGFGPSGFPIGGGGGGVIIDDDFGPPILVTVINNTPFEVDPGIEAEDIDFGVQFVDFGVTLPGDILTAELFCEEAITLTSTDAIQFGVFGDTILEPLPIFELDFDYFCGEEVTFEFVGSGPTFDVFVDADGFQLY